MNKITNSFTMFLKWLSPGMLIKRWLFLSWLGLMIFSFGFLLLINNRLPIMIELGIVDFFHRHFQLTLPTKIVDWSFVLIGFVIMIYAQQKWFTSIYKVIVPIEDKRLVEVIYEKRKLETGYKIVAVGGGTGLSTLLRGIKRYTANITAVVTVSDDGGSSGRLRTELGILPPGDIRNCLVALARDESTLSSLFQYRFDSGLGLEGHSFGNLFLAALNDIAGNDFQKAVKMSSDILSIQGKVFPATLRKTVLCAQMQSGKIIEGESHIPESGEKIEKIFLKPRNSPPLPEVIEAIAEADVILLGPGSLYTSILPNLQVPGIAEAIKKSPALKIYICNVMTQPGETTNYTASQHLKALYENSLPGLVDAILINRKRPRRLLAKYRAKGAKAVKPDYRNLERMNVKIVSADLLNEKELVRHDFNKLSKAIMKTISEEKQGGERGESWKKLLTKLENQTDTAVGAPEKTTDTAGAE